VQHAVPTEVGEIAGVVDEVEMPAEINSGVGWVRAALPGCWVTLFWGEREVPAEALFAFFALLASFAFCFSVAFAVFAFLAFSLSFSRFLRTSPAEEFLWMTYVDTNVRDGQRGDSLGCLVPMERRLLLGDAPATP
jgi:hypothetical protein